MIDVNEIEGSMKQNLSYFDYKTVLDQFVALVEETLSGNLVSVILYGSEDYLWLTVCKIGSTRH